MAARLCADGALRTEVDRGWERERAREKRRQRMRVCEGKGNHLAIRGWPPDAHTPGHRRREEALLRNQLQSYLSGTFQGRMLSPLRSHLPFPPSSPRM